MLYFYVVASAAVMLLLDIPFDIFTSRWSWWAVPLIFIGLILAFIILHILVLLISSLLERTDKPSRDGDVFRWLLTEILHIVFKLLRIKIHSTGLEKVPQDECFLLVCNHIHDFDPAIIYHEVSEARLAFVAKKEVQTLYPLIYKILHKMSGLLIDRENNRNAVKTIIDASNLIKSGTNSVAIFPEGYVSKSGELLPIRNGALKIATKSQCKIVVCSLIGTRDILKNLFHRKTDIYFDVIEVIDASENAHTAELGDTVHMLMEQSIQKHREDKD